MKAFIKKQKFTIIALLVILSVFDILLLYGNYNKKEQIKDLRSIIKSIRNTSLVQENISISNSNIEWPDSELALVILLPEQSCSSCIRSEIYYVENFIDKYDEFARVYSISNKKNYLERFDVNFSYKNISFSESIFNTEIRFSNPIAILVDSTGMVQIFHQAEIGNSEKSHNFYTRIASLFSSLR